MNPPHDAPPSAPEGGPTPVPTAIVDASGLTCGSLEPLIAEHLRTVAPGEIVEILSDRPDAAEGIRAWAGLAGHTLVAVEKDDAKPLARYFVRKKTLQT